VIAAPAPVFPRPGPGVRSLGHRIYSLPRAAPSPGARQELASGPDWPLVPRLGGLGAVRSGQTAVHALPPLGQARKAKVTCGQSNGEGRQCGLAGDLGQLRSFWRSGLLICVLESAAAWSFRPTGSRPPKTASAFGGRSMTGADILRAGDRRGPIELAWSPAEACFPLGSPLLSNGLPTPPSRSARAAVSRMLIRSP
jgi:hypothetical protein